MSYEAGKKKQPVADETHKKGNPKAYSSSKTRHGDKGKSK